MTEIEHQPSIFLCYSSHDQALADELRRTLADAGVRVSRPQDVAVGHEINRATQNMLRESDAFVLFATPDAIDSPWTAYQVGAAMAWEKPIFVVTPNPVKLPAFLSGLPLIRASELPVLVGSVKRAAAPLTSEEQEILRSVYKDIEISFDQLSRDPGAALMLVEKFNRRTHGRSGPDRLLRELQLMRKAAQLPKLRRVSARRTREKRPA